MAPHFVKTRKKRTRLVQQTRQPFAKLLLDQLCDFYRSSPSSGAQCCYYIMHAQGFFKSTTAQANQIRELSGESGVFLPQGLSHVVRCIPGIIELESRQPFHQSGPRAAKEKAGKRI